MYAFISWILCLFMCLCLGDTLHNVGDLLNVKVLETTPTTHGRVKREAGHMPLNFEVQVSSEHGTSHLRLTRSPFIPVSFITNGQMIRDLDDITSQAVYSDRKKRAAFIVKRTDDGYSLEGMLQHGEDIIHIKPKNRVKRQSDSPTGTYQIHSVDSTVTLTGYSVEKQNWREKRAVSSHIIEITFISDAEDYNRYLVRNQYDEKLTLTDLKIFYMFVAQQIQLRYDSVSMTDPDFQITIIITELIIIKDRIHSTYTESLNVNGKVDATAALKKSALWISTPVGGYTFRPTDHYMFFTGFDLVSGGSSSVTGRTYKGELCKVNPNNVLSISIVEHDTTAGRTGSAAAHELGHVLNVGHDGEASVNCTDENYVMTKTFSFANGSATASNPYIFSSCSVSEMKAYLQRADVTCDSDNRYAAGALFTSIKAGQLFDADSQCRAVFGSLSFFCRYLYTSTSFAFNDMCHSGYCYNSTQNLCQATVLDEYTTCGDKKWCVKGQCIADAGAPSRPSDLCPQFDSPGRICNVASCPRYNAIEKGDCCNTCVDVTIPTTSPTTSVTTSPTTSVTSPTTSVTTSPTTSVTTKVTTSVTTSLTTSITTSPTTSPSTSVTTSPTTSVTTSPTTPPSTSITTSVTASQTTSPTTSPVTTQPPCTLLGFINRECETAQSELWVTLRRLMERGNNNDEDDSDDSDSDDSDSDADDD